MVAGVALIAIKITSDCLPENTISNIGWYIHMVYRVSYNTTLHELWYFLR